MVKITKMTSLLCKVLTSTLGSAIIQLPSILVKKSSTKLCMIWEVTFMNKEEILAKSQQEYKKNDPYVEAVNHKASFYSLIAAMVIAFILFTANILITGETNYGYWAIIAAGAFISYIMNGRSRNNKMLTAIGVLWLIMTVAFTAVAIMNMFKSRA